MDLLAATPREQRMTVVLVTHEAPSPPTPTREVMVRDSRVTTPRDGRTVINLGFRRAVAGGREVVARLAVLAASVAVGVGMLLATVAGINTVHARPAGP
jgi:hypothetical protein